MGCRPLGRGHWCAGGTDGGRGPGGPKNGKRAGHGACWSELAERWTDGPAAGPLGRGQEVTCPLTGGCCMGCCRQCRTASSTLGCKCCSAHLSSSRRWRDCCQIAVCCWSCWCGKAPCRACRVRSASCVYLSTSVRRASQYRACSSMLARARSILGASAKSPPILPARVPAPHGSPGCCCLTSSSLGSDSSSKYWRCGLNRTRQGRVGKPQNGSEYPSRKG
jgi:hypothetical protein